MRYKDFEGPIEGLILRELKEIERLHQVRILHAVESGSRAWGFASPDSDYDVRFIYVRTARDYLRLQDQKDFIEGALDETLDINGWDLSKALRHFHKSNATLFEWAGSPIVYHTTPEWAKIHNVGRQYFSCKSAMYHYYGTAKKNYCAHLTQELVRYKKYFYVLRPLLACRWIEQRACPPPVLFQELADSVLEPEMERIVSELLKAKMQMTEAEKAPRIDHLNAYIEAQLSYHKERIEAMEDDRTPDWGALDTAFIDLLLTER